MRGGTNSLLLKWNCTSVFLMNCHVMLRLLGAKLFPLIGVKGFCTTEPRNRGTSSCKEGLWCVGWICWKEAQPAGVVHNHSVSWRLHQSFPPPYPPYSSSTWKGCVTHGREGGTSHCKAALG